MRLINAEKFKGKCICSRTYCGVNRLVAIDSIPTAYDVDKVIEQLEELRSKREEQLRVHLDDGMADYFRCKMSTIAEAIEIVKSGGIENIEEGRKMNDGE